MLEAMKLARELLAAIRELTEEIRELRREGGVTAAARTAYGHQLAEAAKMLSRARSGG